jgi:hypothetical protein
MSARLRPYLMLWFAVPALLLGGLYAFLSQQNIVSGGDTPVFYPALMFYNYTAEALSTGILLVAGTLVGLWVPQALGRRPRAALNGLAVALALAGTALACWGTLPQVFAPYLHLDRAALGGHVYQLGVRYFESSGVLVSQYVLCACDGSGLTCHCHALPAAGTPAQAQTHLLANPADGSLTIQVGTETVYSFHP